eukprot:CAMPEP_0114014952 /NCGR_PEP_ID=MMETSP0372-20130328/12049_1 /TAXON_ID=340204 /ORGANISM="Lankesteria abbotti" /LENGTH=48 /assembly_acc=CAM_ASM_000359
MATAKRLRQPDSINRPRRCVHGHGSVEGVEEGQAEGERNAPIDAVRSG